MSKALAACLFLLSLWPAGGQVSFVGGGVFIASVPNGTDFPQSYAYSYFDKAAGANPTGTNSMSINCNVRLVNADRVRLKRWYNIGDGKAFRSVQCMMTIRRIGD